jgi:hypothetical protein
MAKLIVSCECGQESRVAETAMGKTGLCPYCRRKLRITSANTRPAGEEEAGGGRQEERWQRWRAPSGKAIERFGRAVDCYKGGRYGEALAILDGLAQQYPENPEIEHARFQCVQALQRPRLQDPGHEDKAVERGVLSEDAVRKVVLEKMMKGGDDSARLQLEAARLAAEILGMTAPSPPPARVNTSGPDETPSSGNGHRRRGHVADGEVEKGYADEPAPGEASTEDPTHDE